MTKTIDKYGRRKVVTLLGSIYVACISFFNNICRYFSGFFVVFFSSKAGVPKRLKESASYPREFGLHVAGMIPRGGSRPDPSQQLDLHYEFAGDDLGALRDLVMGPHKTWWRSL